MGLIKVAIADDHKIFRKGVILSLRAYSNIKFVQEAENGQELLDGLLGLTRARVQIAERIRRAPIAGLVFDDAQVFSGGGFEVALPKQLFCVSECAVAIE